MPQQTENTPGTDRRDALEWLYIMFAAGGLLILLALIILTFFTTGRLTQQSEAISQLGQRVAEMEATVARIERSSADRRTAASKPDSPPRKAEAESPDHRALTSRPSATEPAGRTAAPDERTRAGDGRSAAPPKAALADKVIRERFDELVTKDDDGLPVLRDAAAARALLDQAAADHAQSVERTGPAWTALALLARLAGDDEAADPYAARAAAVGEKLDLYFEVSARRAYAADRPAQATQFAKQLAAAAAAAGDDARGAVADLLLAASLVATGQWSQSRGVCPDARGAAVLRPADRLLLCEVLVDLEQWDVLRAVLDSAGEMPEPLAMQRDYLRGVWLASQAQCVEAVAVLDFVLEREPAHYDAQTWRGVALMRAKQPQAARQTLSKAAAASPGRPQAWYWLAVLELNEGKNAESTQYLHNALAASARFAPAWEALAASALNADDVVTAADASGNAIEIDDRRAGAHFIHAVCMARQSRREDAAASLRRAFAIDPTLLERARQTDAVARMFAAGELDGMAPQPRPRMPVATTRATTRGDS